jgi:diguanylate cyclase (GGDEF)-like protein
MSSVVVLPAGIKRRRLPRGFIALGLYMLVYLSWQAFRWIPADQALAGDLLFVPINGAAIYTAWRASSRCAPLRAARRAWAVVAFALALYLAGDIAQVVYKVGFGQKPYPSLADGLYVSFYPVLLVGLLMFPAARRVGQRATELALDCAIVAIGGSAVFLYLIVGPTALASSSSPLQTVFSVAYPVGDMVILVGLASILMRGGLRASRSALSVMAAALVLFAGADLVHGYISIHGTYLGGDPVDTLQIVALGLFAIAGTLQRPLDTAAPEATYETPNRLSWLPYGAVAVGFAMLVIGQLGQAFFPDVVLSLVAVVLAGLVAARRLLVQRRLLAVEGELRTARDGLAALAPTDALTGLANHRAIADVPDTELDRLEQAESRAQYLADHDVLTGLYNRGRLTEELDRQLLNASRHQRSGAVLLINVDNFKVVNDSYGHAEGDRLLKAVADTILSQLGSTDIAARLAGDEFAVLLAETNESNAAWVAEQIRRSLHDRAVGPGIQSSVAVSVFGDNHELGPDDVLTGADIALYEAKSHGGDRVEVYRGQASAALTWVDRIRSALEENRFVLYGQPIVDLRDGLIARHELLIRMVSEDGDIVPPNAFLPTAERFGLIGEIDRWVTDEALRLGHNGEFVTVNLSSNSIGDEQILASTRAAIAGGLDPATIVFEITEASAMANLEAARRFASALAQIGCNLALDDFGTGFDAFSHLKALPAHYLKIDMELVRDIVKNKTGRQVVQAIVGIAHSLDKETVAEGVEDAATMATLRNYGVDFAQGYYIGRPKRLSAPTEFERRLRSKATRHLAPVPAVGDSDELRVS